MQSSPSYFTERQVANKNWCNLYMSEPQECTKPWLKTNIQDATSSGMITINDDNNNDDDDSRRARKGQFLPLLIFGSVLKIFSVNFYTQQHRNRNFKRKQYPFKNLKVPDVKIF